MTTITIQRETLDDMAAQLLDLYWQVVDLTGSEPQPVVNNPALDAIGQRIDNAFAQTQTALASMAASERERVELERALQQQMTAIQWHAMPSRLLPNHPEYYDDPRGREHCRYMLKPMPVRNSTRLARYHVYAFVDDASVEIGTAKTATAAKTIAAEHALTAQALGE